MKQRVRGALVGLGIVAVALWWGGTDAGPLALQAELDPGLSHVSPPLDPDEPGALAPSAVAGRLGAVGFADDQRMVRLSDPMDVDGLLADYDLRLVRPVGRSGYALVEGQADALDAVADDLRVASTSLNARMHGSDDDGDGGSSSLAQWHLSSVEPPSESSQSPSSLTSYVVAVLDSGVAYETATRYGVAYTAAPSLASSAIVAPYDFVNDDPHANDDHQHGTHIASLVASDGAVRGAAPRASLMPVKVLDQHNSGYEYDLVEGIWHAVEQGADVINMSLSFGEGYRPSAALQEALQAADDAGVVMVAAAGNAGSRYVTWPAASPLVIAVGASRPASSMYQEMAEYGNLGGAVDLVAPGGDITRDANGDGWMDGLLAEAVDPGAPDQVGYWLMAGTSQASAVVSGLAVRLLQTGVWPRNMRAELQYYTQNGGDWNSGRGTGMIDLDGFIYGPWEYTVHPTYHVTVLPYLAQDGSQIRPKAKITVFDEMGGRVSGVSPIVSIWGNDDPLQRCFTSYDGSCTVQGAAVPATDGTGAATEFAWSFAVEGIPQGWYGISRPRLAMTVDDALQDVVGGVLDDAQLVDAMLGWSWVSTTDAELGSVAEGYSFVDTGSGLASIPFGVVATPPLVRRLGSVRSVGTTSESGEPVTVTLIELDGSGLASIPLALRRLKIMAMDGTGLSSIPLGLRAGAAHGKGALVKLDAGVPPGLANTPLGAQLTNGGWQVDGYGVASALGSSNTFALAPTLATELDGTGDGAVPR